MVACDFAVIHKPIRTIHYSHSTQKRYRQCAEADSIRAAVLAQEAEAARQEEARHLVEEVQRLLAAGEPIPEHLLPAAVKDPAAATGKGGKKGAAAAEKKKGNK